MNPSLPMLTALLIPAFMTALWKELRGKTEMPDLLVSLRSDGFLILVVSCALPYLFSLIYGNLLRGAVGIGFCLICLLAVLHLFRSMLRTRLEMEEPARPLVAGLMALLLVEIAVIGWALGVY